MKPTEYKKLRQAIGTLMKVGKILGLHYSTILRREKGQLPITKEAALAIKAIGRGK